MDSYSHSLLVTPEAGDGADTSKSAPTSPGRGINNIHQNSAVTLAKAFLTISPCTTERRRSLVTINENCVTVLGTAKIGKSIMIQRLNLFSSSEGKATTLTFAILGIICKKRFICKMHFRGSAVYARDLTVHKKTVMVT